MADSDKLGAMDASPPERFAMEYVTTPVAVEVRSARAGNPDTRTIGGYAAVFNTTSHPLGGFVERVLPSFANKSRADGWPGVAGGGVIALYDHKTEFLLGNTRNNTLRMAIDGHGIDYSVDLPESRSDVFDWVSRGDVPFSSFRFHCVADEWGLTEQGYPMRSLIEGRVIDVGPTATPAYNDTTAGLRSLAAAKDIPLDEARSLSDRDELRSLFVLTGGPAAAPKPMFGPLAKIKTLEKRLPPTRV
jgi:uncharacterized protein